MIVGFDIEITGEIPEGQHWRDVPGLAVSCAALSDATKEYGMLWYSAPAVKAVSTELCAGMLRMLFKLSREHQIIMWNGVGFDIPFLAKVTGEWELATELVKRCYDPCYAMLKLYGFPIGLDKTCIGFNIPGKPEGMDGLKAMSLWSKPLRRPQVMEYVIQDAAAAAMIGKMIANVGEVRWQTGSLAISNRAMGWVPAGEYMQLPMPDQSWMTRGGKPLGEEDFTWWLDEGG